VNRVAVSDLRKACAEILNQMVYRHERIILQRHGKDTAILIPLEDLALLEAIEDQQDLEDARAALAEAREKGTKSLDSITRELIPPLPPGEGGMRGRSSQGEPVRG
jgi:PHD/YefM family antitoxin component YafN of YafNO toxin-antitoxin module